MRAFSINRNRWAQKFLFGALMLALGIVWAQEAFRAKPMQTVEGVFFALFAWYGLMVLSQSFFCRDPYRRNGHCHPQNLFAGHQDRL